MNMIKKICSSIRQKHSWKYYETYDDYVCEKNIKFYMFYEPEENWVRYCNHCEKMQILRKHLRVNNGKLSWPLVWDDVGEEGLYRPDI